MSYTPLVVILLVLVVGAGATLTLLFYANKEGYFDNLKSGAYVIFDDDEPVGQPQDQLFREPEAAPDQAAPDQAAPDQAAPDQADPPA